MGLIDGKQANLHRLQQVQGALLQQTLGGDIEQIQRAGPEGLLNLQDRIVVESGVQELGLYTQALEGVHLILHQGDQRRHHHAAACSRNCRYLIANTLAATGGHQGEGIAAGNDRVNDLPLQGSEALVAEDVIEYVEWVHLFRNHLFKDGRPPLLIGKNLKIRYVSCGMCHRAPGLLTRSRERSRSAQAASIHSPDFTVSIGRAGRLQ